MPSIPGLENLSPAVKYVIAFAIIFVLLALFALILRRLTGGRTALVGDRGRARQPRLGIVDVYDLDRQRQLILLRRDNVEHLLLVGGPNDVVVETNIVRVAGARLPAAIQEADRAENGGGRTEPSYEPVVGATLGTAAGALAGNRRSEPSAALEPVLKPTRVTAGASGGGGEDLGGAGAIRPTFPRANPQPPRPAPEPSGTLDVTRQLEAALRQPSAPAAETRRMPPPPPPPPPAQPPMPVLPPAPDLRRTEPARAEPARQDPPRAEPPRAEPVRTEPNRAESGRAEPPRSRPEPAPPVARPRTPEPAARQPATPPASPPSFRPEPGGEAPRPPAPGNAPPPPSPAPAAPAKPDPFSLEDIEAEFARLLGRPAADKKD